MTVSDATTTDYAALDAVLRLPMAEVRVATDLVKDPWAEYIQALKRAAKPHIGERSAAAPAGEEVHVSIDEGPSLLGMAPWLLDTMNVIEASRRVEAANSPRAKMLDTAEMLASFLVDLEPRRRPQLNIDVDGQPSFATVLDDFYIHLTVDEPNRLTWYATAGGAEHFDEGVAFDGRKLPASLKQLFSL